MTVILASPYIPDFKMHVLLTGATGYIAGYLLRSKPEHVRITAALHHRRPASFSDITNTLPLDLARSLSPQLKDRRFDVVIHAAAMANLQNCERHRQQCMRLNFYATRELAEYCAAKGVFLVFLSTDIVFSGKHAPYCANTVPCPMNVYGQSKWDAEQAIWSCGAPAAVLRLALLLGTGLDSAVNFIDWFTGRTLRGDKIPLFRDEIRTPVWTVDAAHAIWQVVDQCSPGTHHICGDKTLNRLELGMRLLRRMGGNPALLQPVLSAGLPVKRPLNVALQAGGTIPAYSFNNGMERYFRCGLHE